MKILIECKEEGLKYKVDISNCEYPWAIRKGIQESLRLGGYSEDMINEVFYIMPEMYNNLEESNDE